MSQSNQINIWREQLTFMGHFPTAEWHIHGSPVLFVCISGEFEIEFKDGTKERCSSAVVDAGVAHKTYPGEEEMALFYLSPYSIESLKLKSFFLSQSPYQLDVIKRPKSPRNFEKALQSFDIESVLCRKLPAVDFRMDERISQSLRLINEGVDAQNRDEISKNVNLSSSRFNHLFSQKLNVSYRQYKQWAQLGRTLLYYRCERNLTNAALLAGFSDASHFSNTHKKLLGITPSSVLNKNTTLNIFT